MKNAQLSIEFLIAAMVLLSILTLLVSNQNNQTEKLKDASENLTYNVQADVISGYCNLFYFSGANKQFFMKEEIKSKVKCFAPIEWLGTGEVRVKK